MARVEKTVFISYRRKDMSWALAVYQYLRSQKYDVFFDFTSLSSGDFEQVIISNIRARAHFVLILTPTALDRCDEPNDWLRREIETAIAEKRNIVPLFFDGFKFNSPSAVEKLTGGLATLPRYNGFDIPPDYFMEAMQKLSSRYLNVSLVGVIHPLSTEVSKVVKQEQNALNAAVANNWESIKELFKSAENRGEETNVGLSVPSKTSSLNLRLYGVGAGVFALLVAVVLGIRSLLPVNSGITPTMTSLAAPTGTFVAVSVPQENTATLEIPTSTPTVELTNTVTSSPTPGIGSTQISAKDEMAMVYVPDGEFTMGDIAEDASADCVAEGSVSNCQVNLFKDEEPPHTVYLDAYWIDQTEVTNAMFAMFLNQQGNKIEGGVPWLGSKNVRIHLNGDVWTVEAGYENHPVIEVSWYGARTYCSWAGRRLPTEAEWEKAAGWDSDKKIRNLYSWGDQIDCSYANYNMGSKQCIGTTIDVGTYSSKGTGPYGVLDMGGNVYEWVNDWYQEDYYAILGSYVSNPKGPLSPPIQPLRVIRGGSWYSYAPELRTTNRFRSAPSSALDYLGFRCAATP